MRRIAQALSGAVALLLTVTGVAHADVAHVNTSSITATSSSISIPEFPSSGTGRVLAVGISTVESVSVTGVTYGGQPLTSRIARAAHGTRAEIWTLTAPATGNGTVQVTLSGDATATVGASLFTGVDQADPVMAANAGDADTGATSAVAVLNNTTAIDGMLGVLALGNVENTSNVRAGGSTDLVTSDVRWNEVGSVRAAGATRSGNTGQNMALTAGVNWRWNRIDPAQKNPYTLAIVGLRAGAVNTVPSAAAGGPYTTTEGNGVTLDASGSSDADGDTLSYEWDVDGDGSYDDATGVNPTVSAATLAAIGLGDGPDSASVRVRVSDAEAATTSNATTLTITNAAPSAQFSKSGDVVEGEGASVSFSDLADPSAADSTAGLRYAYDFDGQYAVGDPSYAGAVTSATVAVPAALLADGPKTVHVSAKVFDKDGGMRSYEATIEVTNAAPSATLADVTVDEGSTATLTVGDATDVSAPDVEAGLRYAYDFDDDGNWDVGGLKYDQASPLASVELPPSLTAEGDATRNVRAAIVDRDGGVRTYTASVTVVNVAPTATFTGDTVVEGTPATVRFSAPQDPSPADTEAGLTYEYDLDGDGTFEPGGASATLPAMDGPAMREIRGAIVDRDNGRTEYTATVVVTNAAPTASIAGPQTVPSSGVVALTLTAGDPSPSDQLTGVLDWGDGHTETIAGRGEHTVGHTYAAAGDYTVTYEVSEVVEGDRVEGPKGERVTARHTLSVASLPAPRVIPTPEPTPEVTPAPTTTPATGAVAGVTATQPLRISGLAVTPRCVRAPQLRAAISSAKTVGVRFRLSADASVRFSLERWKDKRGAGSCPPVRGNVKADGKRIAGIYNVHSKRALAAHAGVNTVTLAATDGKGKRLRPGTYLLTIRSGATSAWVKVWVLR